MAEDLLGCRNEARVLPCVALTAPTFLDWIHAMLYVGGLEEFEIVSKPDVAGIQAYPDKRESAESAFLILANRLDTLQWKAERLADASRDIYRASKLRNDFQADEANLLFSLR